MPGCDHVATFGHPDLVVPTMIDFLAGMAAQR
jgi:hypothetical protein